MSELHTAQKAMAAYLRSPTGEGAPEGIETRRLHIYRDLVYRNIEGFISSAFPILRSLSGEAEWEALVRDFIATHRCDTPLFLRISEEFLAYLVAESEDPQRPFAAELAHYEWLELAVDVAEGDVPGVAGDVDPSVLSPYLSPAARVASYAYPVHRIGPSFQPLEPAEPTFLLVYRDRDDVVQFVELNPGSARLLHEIGQGGDQTVADLLQRLALEWNMDAKELGEFGMAQIREFNLQGVVGLRSP